jgi:hypothetical protein
LLFRLVFFAKSNDDVTKNPKYYYEDKLKESRRQLVPLAQVLDLPENRTFDKIVAEAMLDLRDVKDTKDATCDDNDDESSKFSDCEDISEDIDSSSTAT